MILEKG